MIHSVDHINLYFRGTGQWCIFYYQEEIIQDIFHFLVGSVIALRHW